MISAASLMPTDGSRPPDDADPPTDPTAPTPPSDEPPPRPVPAVDRWLRIYLARFGFRGRPPREGPPRREAPSDPLEDDGPDRG